MASKPSGPSRGHNRRTTDQTLHCCVPLIRGMNTPMSDSLVLAIESGQHDVIASASIDPGAYTCPDMFWRDYFAVNLLRKSTSLNLKVDKKQVALEAFLASEQSCALVNDRLRKKFESPSTGLSAESYIHTARRNIARVLGDLDWDEAEAHFAFSSGASTRLKRVKGDAFYKYSGKPETTLSCLPLAITAVKRIPLWAASLEKEFGSDPRDWFTVVGGSKITTVPKTAKTDRVIAIEPCMNMFIQKGLGAVIRNRLKRVGIDLNDQTRNQELARAAFSSGLSTIDLASASDSISLELVRALLPPDWFRALCLTRSMEGTLPCGDKHPFEKISSMGNGYTFELESLIFWALARSVLQLHDESDHRLGVYGDDIILSRRCAPILIDVLKYCGFTCNMDKTYIDGNFFESCGKHYFKGIDVTPVYVKEPIADHAKLIWLANSFRRWAARPTPGFADGRFAPMYTSVVERLPPHHREYYIPDGVGDGALIGSFDQITPSLKNGIWSFEVLLDRREKSRPDGPAACLAYFQGSEVGQTDDYYYVVNRQKGRYVKAKMYLSQWADAPLWCV